MAANVRFKGTGNKASSGGMESVAQGIFARYSPIQIFAKRIQK